MRTFRALAALSALGSVAILASACSDPLWFYVDNRTGQSLTIWGFEERCDQITGYRQDYSDPQVAPRNQKFEFWDSWGGSDTRCVQAVDSNRNLLLNEPYEYGRAYRVDSDTPLTDTRIAELSDLPEQSRWDGTKEVWVENPLQQAVLVGGTLLLGLPTLAAIGFAIFVTGRHFYRHYTRNFRQT